MAPGELFKYFIARDVRIVCRWMLANLVPSMVAPTTYISVCMKFANLRYSTNNEFYLLNSPACEMDINARKLFTKKV